MAFSSFQFGWVEMSRFDLAAQSEDPDRRDRFWHDLEQQMERNDLMTLPTKQTQRLRLGGETLFLCVNSHRGSYTPFKEAPGEAWVVGGRKGRGLLQERVASPGLHCPGRLLLWHSGVQHRKRG